MVVSSGQRACERAGKVIKLNLGRLEYKSLTKSDKAIDFWDEK